MNSIKFITMGATLNLHTQIPKFHKRRVACSSNDYDQQHSRVFCTRVNALCAPATDCRSYRCCFITKCLVWFWVVPELEMAARAKKIKTRKPLVFRMCSGNKQPSSSSSSAAVRCECFCILCYGKVLCACGQIFFSKFQCCNGWLTWSLHFLPNCMQHIYTSFSRTRQKLKANFVVLRVFAFILNLHFARHFSLPSAKSHLHVVSIFEKQNIKQPSAE